MSPDDAYREATRDQTAAAEDARASIRVIAGPGSGKSKVIEERIEWLLNQGANPERVFVLSFTNASVKDLKIRIKKRCEAIPNANLVKVSTIHSLALTILKLAGQLAQYQTNPRVLSRWELEKIFDPEFGQAESIKSVPRRREIRQYHEALWGTGQEDHPGYRPPEDEVTEVENEKFDRFHNIRTSVYACVLPGEIVTRCLRLINANAFALIETVGIDYLVVDEFQDLNPTDLAFVRKFAEEGVNIFVAGDDDQSVYSFRYASPAGIQNFTETYAEASAHELRYCFRSPPAILDAASSLITATQSSNRVEKHPVSIHSFVEPPLNGFVHRWRFSDAASEAMAIAESCERLIASGISPKDILILLRSKRSLAKPIKDALQTFGLPFFSPDPNALMKSNTGLALMALLRIACEGEEEDNRDYMAHRILLSLVPGVGVGICNSICVKIIENNLNYRNIFHAALPGGVFTLREQGAIQRVAQVCRLAAIWDRSNTLEERLDELTEAIDQLLANRDVSLWETLMGEVPIHIKLGELGDYIGADSEEAQQTVLLDVRNRLVEGESEPELLEPKISILTMHGAKGLSGQVVFVPGLEDTILPSAKSMHYEGLLQEEARLLYVSITRARASCILSFAQNRFINGSLAPMRPTRFITELGGAFTSRINGLTNDEAHQILTTAERLE